MKALANLQEKSAEGPAMANSSKSKPKLLYSKRILEEETDKKHGLTMTQLIDRPHAYEVPAETYEHDDKTAKTIVKIHKSEPFFGWIAGLSGTVRIHG